VDRVEPEEEDEQSAERYQPELKVEPAHCDLLLSTKTPEHHKDNPTAKLTAAARGRALGSPDRSAARP